jgi:pyruvate/2-oxoglutarate dehydrogenase complex dihydrolipoamide acyltransferase (E2) component
VLGAHLFGEGAAVPVGEAVVRIYGADEQLGAPADAVSEGSAADKAVESATDSRAESRVAAPEPVQVANATGRAPQTLSPRQRRLAQRGPTAEAPDGDAAPTRANASSADAGAAEPASRIRTAIAAMVSESWRTIPHFAVQQQIDATEAVATLAALKTHHPTATYTDLLLRALALAHDTMGRPQADLGLAVATPDGVMLPIVADVRDLAPGELVGSPHET